MSREALEEGDCFILQGPKSTTCRVVLSINGGKVRCRETTSSPQKTHVIKMTIESFLSWAEGAQFCAKNSPIEEKNDHESGVPVKVYPPTDRNADIAGHKEYSQPKFVSA